MDLQRSLFCATASQSSSSYSKTPVEAAALDTGLGKPGGIIERRRFEGSDDAGKRTVVICFTSSRLKRARQEARFGALGGLGVGTLTSLPSILLEIHR
jgi:hypothetical protein